MVVDLPGAVRPEEAGHHARPHGEGQAVDGESCRRTVSSDPCASIISAPSCVVRDRTGCQRPAAGCQWGGRPAPRWGFPHPGGGRPHGRPASAAFTLTAGSIWVDTRRRGAWRADAARPGRPGRSAWAPAAAGAGHAGGRLAGGDLRASIDWPVGGWANALLYAAAALGRAGAAALVLRGLGRLQRERFRALLGVEIAAPPRARPAPGRWRLVRAWRAPATWRQLGYHLLAAGRRDRSAGLLVGGLLVGPGAGRRLSPAGRATAGGSGRPRCGRAGGGRAAAAAPWVARGVARADDGGRAVAARPQPGRGAGAAGRDAGPQPGRDRGRRPTPSAAASSATCTTAPSSGWCPWP